jgi:GTP cyclohydrolase II
MNNPDPAAERGQAERSSARIQSNGLLPNVDGDLSLEASAELPTTLGTFVIYGFLEHSTGKEHTAIVKGEVNGAEDVPVRVHSQCHTGDVLGSLRCDCRDQLHAALSYIAGQERGAVVYLMQEGRGIGLINKIKAYRLQEMGLDTVEANEYLGFRPDERRYSNAAAIIRLLGIKSIAVMSNNPDKIDKIRSEGITISRRIPVVIPSNPHSEIYLETKRVVMGHLF